MNDNNKMEESNHSENLYAYQDNESQNNEPPKESTAIRRSIGREGNPFGSKQTYEFNNKLSNNNINKNIQSMQINNNNRTLSENQDNLQAPNYDKSSEQRMPNNNIQQSQQSKQISNNYNNNNQDNQFKSYIPFLLLSMLQVFAVIIFAICYKLEDGDPKNFGQKDYLNEDYKDFGYYFHFFKDVNLMIFIGLGLLYCSLKDHQLSSISLVLFLGIISLEFSLFWNYLWNNSFKKGHHETKYGTRFSKIKLDMEEITQIDFFGATVLVSLGAVIGKLTLGQYLVITLFETFFASLNYYLCYFALGGIDNGGSLYIFAFGAIFGFIVSFILAYDNRYKDILQRNQSFRSDYYSNVISAIGSLFLWLYFPSFNTSRIHYDPNKKVMDIMRYRGIINTYMSMIGSLVATFCTSALVMEERKFKIEHILRSSYVGGVIIAGCCTFCAYPWCALLIGFFGGILSVILSHYATPKSQDLVQSSNPNSSNVQNCCEQFLFALKMSDTMGVMYCFGIPGILGGIFTAIFLGSINRKPWKKTVTINEVDVQLKVVLNDLFYYSRSPSAQGGIQLGVLFITIAMAFVSGIVTGFIVKFLEYDRNENLFMDSMIFEEPNNFGDFNSKKILSSSENKLNNDDNEEGREVEVNQENNNNYYIK